MGIFLAKIARGRTLREFTIYNFLLPGLFGIVWFGIFGSSAIFYETNGGGIYQSMQELGTESAVFAFFKNMPISAVLDVVFLFTAFLSIVTLCDSMTTTISSLSINSQERRRGRAPRQDQDLLGHHRVSGLLREPGHRQHRGQCQRASTPPSSWPSPPPSP